MRDQRLIGCGTGFPDNLLWHLDRSDSASGALDRYERRRVIGRGAVVYLLDSGVKRDHDEFQRATSSNVIAEIILADQGDPCPGPFSAPHPPDEYEIIVCGHGTATASVVAGKRTGVAPDASIVSVRSTSSNDRHWTSALKAVVAHAFDPSTPPFNTAIVSMSFAPGFGSFPLFEEQMRLMINGINANGFPNPNGKRFLFVALAGNLGALRLGYREHCTTAGEVVRRRNGREAPRARSESDAATARAAAEGVAFDRRRQAGADHGIPAPAAARGSLKMLQT